MDHTEAKELLRKYVNDLVDSEELKHLFVHDPEVGYARTIAGLNDPDKDRSRNFTHIHKCVSLTGKYPKINDYLREYLSFDNSNVNTSCSKEWTPLFVAVRSSSNWSSTETVKILIDAGADIKFCGTDGWSILAFAVRNSNNGSNVETIKMLIDAGADVNSVNKYGFTPLIFAAAMSNTDSNIETVKLLIDAGANINYVDKQGQTALSYAIKYSDRDSNVETVKLLIDLGAVVNDQVNIFEAARMPETPNQIEIFKLLVEKGVDINQVNIQGISALWYLTQHEFGMERAKLLIDSGVKIKLTCFKSKELCKYYVEHKLCINDNADNECLVCYDNRPCYGCEFNHMICDECLIELCNLTCVTCKNILI